MKLNFNLLQYDLKLNSGQPINEKTFSTCATLSHSFAVSKSNQISYCWCEAKKTLREISRMWRFSFKNNFFPTIRKSFSLMLFESCGAHESITQLSWVDIWCNISRARKIFLRWELALMRRSIFIEQLFISVALNVFLFPSRLEII